METSEHTRFVEIHFCGQVFTLNLLASHVEEALYMEQDVSITNTLCGQKRNRKYRTETVEYKKVCQEMLINKAISLRCTKQPCILK